MSEFAWLNIVCFISPCVHMIYLIWLAVPEEIILWTYEGDVQADGMICKFEMDMK